MNQWWHLLCGSLLGVAVTVACSDSETRRPSGQAGGGGADSAGSAGSAGKSNQAGSSQQGGRAGAGGSNEPPEGGTENVGTAGSAEAGAGGAPVGGPIRAKLGELCPVEATIGVVQLAGFPEPYVQGTLYDTPDPWIGEAELTTSTCAYHEYTAGGCPACEAGEVCSLAGECVPERRTIKDATLLVSTGGDEREYLADPQLGGIYSQLDIGDAEASFAMSLSWGEGDGAVEIELPAMPVASGEVQDIAVTIEGDSSAPGALDATWQASNSGAFVRSRIPINHHAAGPTFTECVAPESAGSFHADADMIDPLAVVTGLEFQGVEHLYVAAAATPRGCVEFRFGPQLFVFPN